MKKLYRKGTVHPSPPVISDQLSFLPATILTLTAALSPEDREVLAYLISCSSNNTPCASFPNFSGNRRRGAAVKCAVVDGDHAPLFSCCCFRCYMSYWVRWDSSPNRQLIHEIIDAFEDWLAQNNNKGGKNRKEKRNNKRGGSSKISGELKRTELVSSERSELVSSESTESTESESVGEGSSNISGEGVEEEEKGSVRRFVSFIGERIWGAWGQ